MRSRGAAVLVAAALLAGCGGTDTGGALSVPSVAPTVPSTGPTSLVGAFDGGGTVTVAVDRGTNMACATVAGVSATALRLDEAPQGATGPVRFSFPSGTGGCAGAAADVVLALIANPVIFYVEADVAGGRHRAQLRIP